MPDPIRGEFARAAHFIIPRIPDLSSTKVAGEERYTREHFLFDPAARFSPPRLSTLRLAARQFMRGKLLRPRIVHVRSTLLLTPRVSSLLLFPPRPPSPPLVRTMFVLIIIRRATTVAQRLLLADYSPGRSRNRSIVRSLKRCFRLYRRKHARTYARTHA